MVRIPFVAKDGTRVVFREPKPTDARLFLEFINPIVSEPMSGLMLNEKVKMRDERVWVKRRLADIRQRKTVMLVVEYNGRVVGNCDLTRKPGKQAHMALLGVALSKEMRGRGIGEELMRRSIALAHKRFKGLERVELTTFSYNKRAQALYKKLGFIKVGRMPRALKEGRRYFDEFFMILDLPK